MKSLRIVRSCLQRYVVSSKEGGLSTKEPGTLVTVFVLSFTILLAGVWVQLSASVARSGSKGPGGGGGKKKPHTVVFSGDIEGTATGVNLDPDNPLNRVTLDDFVVDFMEFSRGTPTCCTPDCDGFVDGWGLYDDNNSWMGPMLIKRTKQGGIVKWHVSFSEGTNLAGGSINLVVQAVPEESSPTTTLTFANARGLVSAFSSPDGGDPDPNDRCLDFTITATPE